MLIFVLHNIGLQLRKKDPVSIKQILDLFNQKKNNYQATQRIDGTATNKADQTTTPMENKIKFLVLEL